MSRSTPRLPFAVLLTAALSAAAVISESDASPDVRADTRGERAPLDALLPLVPDPDAVASTHFCTAGTAVRGGLADHTVVVVNPGESPVTAWVTPYGGGVVGGGGGDAPGRMSGDGAPADATPSHGPATGGPPADAAPVEDDPVDGPATGGVPTGGVPTGGVVTDGAPSGGEPPDPGAHGRRIDGPAERVVSLTIGPGERESVRLGDLVDAPYVAAVVEVAGGAAVVEHEVVGPLGRDRGPCATRAGTAWHLAWGATTRDAREVIVVFNPFPSPASVDVVARTERGGREPVALQGVPVPGAGLVALDLGAEVRREQDVAATITARRGRVVVERLQSFDGSDGPAGLSVALASPEPATAWAFAGGEVRPAGAPVVAVYNPGDERAEVDVAVLPDAGGDGRSDAAPQPFGLSIGPHDLRLVRLGDEARVPSGVGLAIQVTARNRVPVVAERIVRTAAPEGAPEGGLALGPGAPVAARTWWLGGPVAGDASPSTVAVFNPGRDGWARVTLRAIDGGSTVAATSVGVPPGGRRTVRLRTDPPDPEAVLVLGSTTPVVAERVVAGRGVVRALSPGVPEAGGAVPVRVAVG